MRFRFQITGSGEDEDEDDKTVGYNLQIENKSYKTTIKFYDYADAFDDFANKLSDFPFENKSDVVFKIGDKDMAYDLTLKVKLVDAAGACAMVVKTRDMFDQTTQFNIGVEVADIQSLAKMLKTTDFSVLNSKEIVF